MANGTNERAIGFFFQDEDWEAMAAEQERKVAALRESAHEERRRAGAFFRKFSETEEGKEAMKYLREKICGADSYPVFDDARKEHFWVARRWVWGQLQRLMEGFNS